MMRGYELLKRFEKFSDEQKYYCVSRFLGAESCIAEGFTDSKSRPDYPHAVHALNQFEEALKFTETDPYRIGTKYGEQASGMYSVVKGPEITVTEDMVADPMPSLIKSLSERVIEHSEKVAAGKRAEALNKPALGWGWKSETIAFVVWLAFVVALLFCLISSHVQRNIDHERIRSQLFKTDPQADRRSD